VNISLTVSDLDAFRRYREMEELTLADLLRSLRREDGPTPAMLAGSALHALLENPPADADSLAGAVSKGHRFVFECDATVPVLPFREVSGSRTFEVAGNRITLRGRCDAFDGTAIDDHKLTGQFDAERYISRYQWRAYLSIFNATKFTYNVFVGAADGADEDGTPVWKVSGFHRLTVYRYPDLDRDIARELARFAEFARQHFPEAVAA
jgi:hypothetical protein